jgi:hypothetical protein
MTIPDGASGPQLPGWGIILLLLVDKVLDWFSRRGMGQRLGKIEEHVKLKPRLKRRSGAEDDGK